MCYFNHNISADLSAKKAFILNHRIKRLSQNQHIDPLPEYSVLYLQAKALSDSKTWKMDVWNPNKDIC